MTASEVQAEIIGLGIDSANILYVFTWGFGAVVFFYFLGVVIGAAKAAIKRM